MVTIFIKFICIFSNNFRKSLIKKVVEFNILELIYLLI
jgi:hypothetical protein